VYKMDPPDFKNGETVCTSGTGYYDHVCMTAAARLAAMFAAVGERGFGIFHEVGGREPKGPVLRSGRLEVECLARLCFVANTTVVPPVWRKAAAELGGLPTDDPTVIPPYTQMPHCGCPGPSVYKLFVDELCRENAKARLPLFCGDGFDRLHNMNAKHTRHVVCAALAAADCALAAGQHSRSPQTHPEWVRDWRDVQGGGCQQDDTVTQWMVRKLLDIARIPPVR
jgi:hypothetical protein